MEKKEGKYPINSRVNVDYIKGKPKIKFSYPYKDKGKESLAQGGCFFFLILIWFLIGVLPFLIFYFNYMNTYEPFPESCSNFSLDNTNYEMQIKYSGDKNSSNDYNLSFDYVYGFNITCDNNTKIFKFLNFEGEFEEITKERSNWLLIIFCLWLYASLVPASMINKHLITRFLVKKKWYQKWLPIANAEGVIIKKRIKNYYKFRPRDVLENVVVIPYFSNVELDYKTKGDFSKYLKSIRIREYRKQTIKKKSKKKSKIKQNKFKWYAIFFFERKPTKGHLEVTYI